MGTTLGVAGMAAPVLNAMQPTYDFPTATPESSNYAGPYTPTPRDVRYPTAEERKNIGSSEYMYFNPSNPVPYAEGGKVDERGSVQMPGADYVAGQNPEFNYGFKPVEIAVDTTKVAPATIGGKGVGRIFSAMGQVLQGKDKDKSNYTDLSGYEYDPQTQTMRKMANGGVAMLSKGGSVPTLENGGFVLTKKAVDGLGKGDNKKGQKVASAGLGAIPIRGKGTGTSDSIKTSIDGERPALVSNGEAYVPKKQVAKHGGAKKFYALMKKAERAAA
jgi:hypothetical protein